LPAFRRKRFAKNLALVESPPSDDSGASPAIVPKAAPVIPIESAGVESARESSGESGIQQWVERNLLFRADSIAMAAVIALLPIGAMFLVRTDKIFPRSLLRPNTRTTVSLPVAQARKVASVQQREDKAVPASQSTVVRKGNSAGIVSDIRYTSDADGAVVILNLDPAAQFQVHRLTSPERIYLDLRNTKPAPMVTGKQIQTQGQLRAIRVGQHERQTTRITLATAQTCDYSVTRVPNSSQLRIELRKAQPTTQASQANSAKK
jgi:hypothetical protein